MKKKEPFITFDRSSAALIIKMFPEYKRTCSVCGCRITAKNLGQVSRGGFTCNSMICLTKLLEDII